MRARVQGCKRDGAAHSRTPVPSHSCTLAPSHPRTLQLLRIPALLLLLAAGTARAQVDTLRLPFTALTIDDGLAQGMVSSIAQDKYGFLWFATKDGLDRYDGYSFTTFRHDPDDSTSIAGNTVNWLQVDHAQRLWVVSDGGVDLFDPAMERFRHVPIMHPQGLLRTVRQAIADANGDLWACGNDMFVKVTFARPPVPEEPLPSCTMKWFKGDVSLTLLSDGRLWGTDQTRALRITPSHGGQDRVDTLPPWNAGMAAGINGMRFIEDTVRGILRGIGSDFIATIDRGTGRFLEVDLRTGSKGSVSQNGVVCDEEGKLWLAGSSGLRRYDPAGGQLLPVTPLDPAQAKVLRSLKSCFMDHGGTLWLGSSGHGLLKYDPRTARFNKWDDSSIRTLVPTPAGNVLVGRWWELLAEFDPVKRRYARVIKSTKELSMPAAKQARHQPGDMAVQDAQGIFWVSLNYGNLLRYDPAAGAASRILRPGNVEGKVEDGPMFPLMLGSGPTLWAGGNLALWRYDIGTHAFTPYPWPVPTVNDPYNFTVALHEGRDGLIWAGTVKGLMRLDLATGDWRQYMNDRSDPHSLASDIIFSICADPDDPTGVLWIGTNGGGLNRFDVHTGKVERITTRNGLPNDVVYGVLADGDGRLWMSTNKGIACYDRHSKSFRTFTVNDGLQSNEFNRNAYAKGRDGTLFFGGVNGFNYFDPRKLTADTTSAPIHITGVKLINKPVDFRAADAPLKEPAYLSTGMTIPYDANMVTFEFATLEFAAPQDHHYRYKLEGFDKEWIQSGTERSAVYTNLDPGTYTFRVRGDNRDGVWGAQAASFTLTVLPPWWRTWWAWALYVLAVAGAIVTYIRLRTGGLKRQRALLERTVAERTIELSRQKDEADQQRERAEHSERVKQQFLANMSHEIRTPMNAIVGMGNLLRRNEHLPAQQQYIDAITSSSENLLGIVNEILDLSKIEAGKLELEKVAMDPRAVLNGVLDVLRHRAEEKGLRMAAAVGADVPAVVAGDPGRLNQVLMNLVGNAIKFTEHGTVRVGLAVQERLSDAVMLRFEVADTGIGIAPERLAHVFEEFMQAESDHTRRFGGTGLGLAISKRLVEMQGGTITAESDPGEGSVFTFVLPYAHAVADALRPGNEQRATNDQPQDLCILLVEDNKLNVLVAEEELKIAVPGARIDVAANGQLAVDMHAAGHYDLILMDVQMPVMDGYAATRAVRAMPGDKGRVPIVAMTANVMEAEVRKCREAGMDGFVPKPFRQEELAEAIGSAMGGGHQAK